MLVADDLGTAKACLTDLGYGSIFDTLPKRIKETTPFYCSILKTDVYVPCTLRSCPFWISRDVSKNCLLCYHKERPGGEDLSTREIADVLDCTIQEVTAHLESGITSLRHMAIGLPIGNQDLQESFEFLPTDTVCCVCERPTPQRLKDTLRIPELGLAYCSLNCRVRKNPTVINLENRFHADIADILTWTLANFVKVSAMEQALKMDSYAIQQLIRQFLGQEALKAFPGEQLPEAVQPFPVLFSFNRLS